MAILESLYFTFAGEKSSDYGITNVNASTSSADLPFSEPFLAQRQIKEVTVRGREMPYFQDIQYTPLTLTLSFAFQDSWDEDAIRKVARWLRQSYYQPLIFSETPNRIFYCMYTDAPMLLHNGLQQGYVTISMRCDTSYAYSNYYTEIYDMSNNPSNGTKITLVNNGDLVCYPQIWITKVGNGDISIVNGSANFQFTSILDGEEIYVDCENEVIKSSLPGVYRFANFSDQFISMSIGNNYFNVTGTCQMKIIWQCKLLAG